VSEQDAIRATIEAYFSAVDRRDWVAYGQCFTADAVFELSHHSTEIVSGREAIVERAERRMNRPVSNHLLSNMHARAAAGRATATTHAIAHLAVPRAGGDVIVVRRNLYVYELVHEGDGRWRISRRRHEPLWQFEAAATALGY
jgi:uncharacterized protein (TIGR02246 family)